MTRRDFEMIWLIASRELWDQLRDWRIIFPMLVLTIAFPFLMNFTAGQAVGFVGQYGATIIGERLVPFFLMVVGFFPITVALVGSLETFVGEKERGTIEPLLNSPLPDWNLYLGKLVSGTILPLTASYLGISVYLIGLVRQGIPLPEPGLIFQTMVLTAVQAILMVSGAMVISVQATTVKAANLLASFIIIPMTFLIQGESVLMFWGNNQVLWLAVLGVSIMALLVSRVGLAHFQREQFLGRELDMLNIGWMWRTFLDTFTGGAKNIFEWYWYDLPATLRRIRVSISVTLLTGLAVAIFGYYFTNTQLALLSTDVDKTEALREVLDSVPIADGQNADLPGAGFLMSNNTRVVVIIGVLGMFSFSVLGMLAYLLNMSVIGVVMAGFQFAGFNAMEVFVKGVLPHGLFEIPAIIITSAAVLHLGVLLVTPDPRRTFGQVTIEGLALWSKLAIGLGLPMLFISALIEAYLTPLLLASITF